MNSPQQPRTTPLPAAQAAALATPSTAPAPRIHLVHNDLPAGVTFASGMAAIDTETIGLDPVENNLCLIQISDGPGPDGAADVYLIKFDVASGQPDYTAPNLRAVLENPRITKIFHYARFDLAMLQRYLGIAEISPSYCTKIASKLARPQDGKHNLRTLCRHYLGIELDKSEQLSNWAVPELSESQMRYAASDVLYLHQLFACLNDEITQQERGYILDQALRFLPTRVAMDIAGLPESDLFAHH